MKFKRSHAARPDIAKALNRIEGADWSPLRDKPGIDQGIAEFIREGIGQHARQAFERFSRQPRKFEGVEASRHHNRCQLEGALGEVGHILEYADLFVVEPTDGTDVSAPQADGRVGHCSSSAPHAQSVALGASVRVRARRRSCPSC